LFTGASHIEIDSYPRTVVLILPVLGSGFTIGQFEGGPVDIVFRVSIGPKDALPAGCAAEKRS
jgi:hypothetical protein